MKPLVEKVVNEMEGYTSSNVGNEDDDLDIVRKTKSELAQVDLSQYIDNVTNSANQDEDTAVTETTDDDVGIVNEARVEIESTPSHVYNAPAQGSKVEWSSEEDDPTAVYRNFTDRHTLKRKRVAAGIKRAKKSMADYEAKKARERTSIVGRRVKRVKPKGEYIPSSDEDNQLLDEILPAYIKQRKKAFQTERDRLGEAGLRLPPEWDSIEFSDDERLGHLKERPYFPDSKSPRPYKDVHLPTTAGVIPAPIAQWLREYQIDGARFLHELFIYQRGGLLGDDMGLGKTIQVIAFLTAACGKTGDERDKKRMRKFNKALEKQRSQGRANDAASLYPRILIICPGTLMSNWESELKTWGYWTVYLYHGDQETKDDAINAAKNGRLEIMITTYDTYRKSMSIINTVDWDAVIADECHELKNRTSAKTRSMNEINALCRIGLTGTAIQNKYEEFFTLLNWTNPGRFGSMSTWKECISKPLQTGQAHDATIAQLAKARKTADTLVKKLLPPFFLRRMKSLIAHQLPKKRDRVVFCPLTEKQAEAYQNLVDSDIIEYIRTSGDECDCDSR
jgi:DNA excision repair protein ERCC-6-like 2